MQHSKWVYYENIHVYNILKRRILNIYRNTINKVDASREYRGAKCIKGVHYENIQKYNKLNGCIKRYFLKNVSTTDAISHRLPKTDLKYE
jgi:hypothetical protein